MIEPPVILIVGKIGFMRKTSALTVMIRLLVYPILMMIRFAESVGVFGLSLGKMVIRDVIM